MIEILAGGLFWRIRGCNGAGGCNIRPGPAVRGGSGDAISGRGGLCRSGRYATPAKDSIRAREATTGAPERKGSGWSLLFQS
jgi:hypothetical protein